MKNDKKETRENNVIIIHVCKRCNWNWPQRGSNDPKVCPKCRSPYWNTERKEKQK